DGIRDRNVTGVQTCALPISYLPRLKANPKPTGEETEVRDKWISKFLAHLATDRGASVYTQRNYSQALTEFFRWHTESQKSEAQRSEERRVGKECKARRARDQ